MTEKILILDFGSQFTQLIARAVREANVFCEIIPFQKKFEIGPELKGIILSGSPCSVNEENAPSADIAAFIDKVPVLGICYGAQLTAKLFGGRIDKSNKREFGRAKLHIQQEDILLSCHTVLQFLQQLKAYRLPALKKQERIQNRCMAYSFTPKYITLQKAKRSFGTFLSISADAARTGHPLHL
jgi:anthranilate/para-aminobenzoate synthase component II